MRCNPIEHPLLCAEAPFLSKDAREKMVEHLFESFSCPAVFLAKNPVLSSFALGRQTSLVVDIGHAGTIGTFHTHVYGFERVGTYQMALHAIHPFTLAGKPSSGTVS